MVDNAVERDGVIRIWVPPPGVDGPLSPASTLTSTLKSGLETHLRGEPEPRSELQPCLRLPTLRKKVNGGLVKVKKQRKEHLPGDLPRGPCSRGNLHEICEPFPWV